MLRTNDRQKILDLLDSGANVFVTGPAGCGKTHLIREWAAGRSKANEMAKLLGAEARNILVTATTGVASLLLGGTTIHKATGIGVHARPEEFREILGEIWAGNHKSRERIDVLRGADAILIDEASMLRSDQLLLIDLVLRQIRGSNDPFGGVQMVMVGDFLQLPPVVTDKDRSAHKDLEKPFAFQSPAWSSITPVELTTNWRQSDPEFLDLLTRLRIGQVSDADEELYRLCVNAPLQGDPVRLFPYRVDVDRENSTRLGELPGESSWWEVEFDGEAGGIYDLRSMMPCDEVLVLKHGARVMSLINCDEGYANGSLGTVLGYNDRWIDVDFDGAGIRSVQRFEWQMSEQRMRGNKMVKEVVATAKQFPLKLAYASTIHKAQGLTLDKVDCDVAGCFAPGMAYVAISRVREMENLTLRSWDRSAAKADEAAMKFYKEAT